MKTVQEVIAYLHAQCDRLINLAGPEGYIAEKEVLKVLNEVYHEGVREAVEEYETRRGRHD